MGVASHEEMQRLQIEAQRLRAEAAVDTIFAIGHAIAWVVSPVVRLGQRAAAGLARQSKIDRIYGELSRMADRDLADIGLGRGDIQAVAYGTYRRDVDADLASVVRLDAVAKSRPAVDTVPVSEELPRAA
jgi:uncharacterized protein YjiS (DUF1127 family)